MNIVTRDLGAGFPVDHGQVVRIKCVSGYSLVGEDEIICVKDNNYLMNNQPECVLGKIKV